MKNLYASFLLLAPFAASAQLQPARFTAAPELNGHTKGVSYYSESFDESLNGWSAETTVGVVDWKWTNVGPGPTSSTYPVPPLATSTPSGWAIIDDDFDGVGGQSTDASLISPPIDLSEAPANLRVRFEQYFQEFQLDACFVGVSTDDGTTWDEVEINAGVGREGRPNPEVIEVNISEWVAANPSFVRLRFRYTSTWDYGWQVDNIAIVEQFQYDLMAMGAYLSNTGTGEEYHRIPPSQLNPTMLVGGEVKNDGSLPQTGVVANMLVQDESSNEAFSATSTIGNLAANTSVFMEEFATVPSLAPGLYTATFSATSDQQESDANVTNNSEVRAFEVNNALYGMDGIGIHPGGSTIGSLGTNSFADAEDGLKVMVYYEIIAPQTVHGVQFLLTGNSSAGGYVTAEIYDTTSVLGNPANFSSPVVESPAYDIVASDVSAGNVNLLFDAPVVLQPGAYYAALTLYSNAGAGTIRIQDDLTVAQPALASVIFVPGDQVFTNGNAMAVRLITEIIGGVGTNASNNTISVFPNPSTGLVQIELGQDGVQQADLFDATGALVRSFVVNRTTMVDLSDLAKGLYTLQVNGANGAAQQRIALH
ncbi:MAG: T9SS type A sorting domain-containing protein [Flavobacteriales bacterium]|jgi:hypothetical protein|nr:T9SS type A sorting domain-containing protein [Flavobacteriales bacterium]